MDNDAGKRTKNA